MANQEHLAILEQGVEAWNKWRRENTDILPDLSRAKLSSMNLNGADLIKADLNSANLIKADLSGAYLRCADLSGANLINADLSGVDLSGAKLSDAYLSGAKLIRVYLYDANLSGADLFDANLNGAHLNSTDLSRANLNGAHLNSTDLSRAHLSGANLSYANFSHALLQNTNFADARLGRAIFIDNDLSVATGLESVRHDGPSYISIDTLYKSGGNIPEPFLRGCGLSDWEIESAKLYNRDLSNEEINNIYYRIHDFRVSRAFQINPLFISYSHSDSTFIDGIEKYLIESGIRFWRDVHHAISGRLERQVDQAIHLNDVVLLVLSEHSTKSDWVEHEAHKAREKEKQTGKDALCPVALDDSWKTCRWPAVLREQIEKYHILDFSNWRDEVCFQRMFSRLLEGLNLFYK